MYLHHPIQAYNFVAFSVPKTFVYRHKSSERKCNDTAADPIASDSSSLTAVTFSESHEVLNRLSSAFWPGFVTIYAPVRTRRLKKRSITPMADEEKLLAMRGSESISSLTSLSSEGTASIDDSAMEVFPTDPIIPESSLASFNSVCVEAGKCSNGSSMESLRSVPVVPDSILRSAKELSIPEGGDRKEFIGIRCPSHPLARKILSTSYGKINEKSDNRLKGGIIGMNAISSTTAHSKARPNLTCKDVCLNLQSAEISGVNNDVTNMEKPLIHVVNGEDWREQFNVPPCQFGFLPSISLVIDTPRRNVILLCEKNHSDESSQVTVTSGFDVTVKDVKRALHHFDNKNSSIKNRAVAAVMSKWNVTEIII